MHFRAIDLFAGGGGLTVGLKRAGFAVVAAIENDAQACRVYMRNHGEVEVLQQDVRKVTARKLVDRTGIDRIDLVAGCPPCQGFTSLTAKYRKEDTRNELVLEMLRFADEFRPLAMMMENVPGLLKTRIYGELLEGLDRLGYEVTEGILQVASYGVPQFRRRLVLLAGLRVPIELPNPSHSGNGGEGLERWRTVWDTIGHMRSSPPTLAEVRGNGGVQHANWHVVRTLSPQNLARIRAAQPGQTWPNMPEELRPKCHQGKYKGFTNMYGRMEWHKPSPTITGGCTTLSKGRFGHPEEDRTISVREAALLQTFPESYVFDTPYMEHVCNIIGNALPCDFAEVVARQCFEALHRKKAGGGT